jgi:hypothetical protein
MGVGAAGTVVKCDGRARHRNRSKSLLEDRRSQTLHVRVLLSTKPKTASVSTSRYSVVVQSNYFFSLISAL